MVSLAEVQRVRSVEAPKIGVVERLNPEAQNDVLQTAALYADVFAGDPWNENTLCNSCDTYFGTETHAGDGCPSCQAALQEAYPLDATAAKVYKEVTRDNAAAFVILDDNEQIKAFGWGFSYASAQAFAAEKYHDASMQEKTIGILQQQGIDGPFFYLSEAGVHPNFRGKGLGNTLAELLVREAELKRLPLVMRTNKKSAMVAVAKRYGMEQIQGPEVKRINDTVEETGKMLGHEDTENEDRVLFMLQSKQANI